MTTRCRLNLDHVGVLGADVEALAGQWRRLGFQVVGPAELKGVDDEGRSRSLRQSSAHVMFADHYVELTSVTPPAPGHHLERFLGEPAGLRLLILRSSDIEADQQRCGQDGLLPGPVADASRQISYGSGGSARFRWFALDADRFPEALVCFAQHCTPELVFNGQVAQHPNGVVGLRTLWLAGPRLPQRYLALAEPGQGLTLEARPAQWLADALNAQPQDQPPLVAMTAAASDLDRVEAELESHGVPFHRGGGQLRVAPAHCGGVAMVFEPVR